MGLTTFDSRPRDRIRQQSRKRAITRRKIDAQLEACCLQSMLASAHLSPIDDSVGTLARARRFLGRVLHTVRRPSDLPPPFEGRVAPTTAFSERAEKTSMVALREAPLASVKGEVIGAWEIEVQLAEKRALREQAALRLRLRALLDARLVAVENDLTWIGIRVASEGDQTLVAWRVTEADVLRTVEVRCAIGDENSLAETTTEDVPAGMNVGSTIITSDALRLVVALGVLDEGRFVSRAHAVVR